MLTLDNIGIRQGSFRLSAGFQIPAGRKIAIIGPSGAGKSTLINAICGFIPLDAGRLEYNGKDITNAPPQERDMAMIFQDNNLFPHLTVAQNTGLGLTQKSRLNKAELARIDAALERVGLKGFAHRKPARLSGGQQSRAALARALLQKKSWMVLDEPFAALGPALRAQMLDLVSEVADETRAGVLMVTHAPEDARRIADEVVFVAEGTAHPPQATQDLFNNPPPALRAYLG